MGAVDIDTALEWRGHTVVDRDGEKIGTLREIYLDDKERPSWGSVHTGLFGLRETFVPLTEAELVEDELRLPYPHAQVEQAPGVDPDVQLSADEEDRLYQHYGITAEAAEDRPTEPRADDEPGAVASGSESAQPPDRPSDDNAMTRSEEEVRVGKRTRVRGRARLKKYVVTDYVEKRIPVRREEVRLEYDSPRDE
jgi:hypothetical protein